MSREHGISHFAANEVALFLEEALPKLRLADLHRHIGIENCKKCQRQVEREIARHLPAHGIQSGAPPQPTIITLAPVASQKIQIPDFDVLYQLGRGGMGAVYL